MELKICILIIVVLVLIIVFLLRKKALKILRKIWNSKAISKFSKVVYKFVFKTVEVFWIVILGTIILLPLFIYYFLQKTQNISYDEYKELLQIILNSNYVLVIGILIVVYLFRNQIKRKIEQIKEVNGNGVIFEDTQSNRNTDKGIDINEQEDKYNIMQKTEEIYVKIKNGIKSNSKKSNVLETEKDKLDRLQKQNIELENELKNKNRIIRKEKFINIKLQIAPTTHMILVHMYNKYKHANLFTKEEIAMILENLLYNERYKVSLNLEREAIIQCLLNNKIIDTEDDKTFSVTEFGIEFLKFLFEGGY